MLLIVSDIHFGKDPTASERRKEADLLALLDATRDQVDSIYFLGDVFDQFVEYRHLVPKGFVRFQGALARLTDAGVPIHYVVGNHDPWHLDYFDRELGVTVHTADVDLTAFGRQIVLSHGDAADSNALSRWMRAITRHPLSAALFRTLLPADEAYRLTRWTKNRFGSEPVDPATVAKLRDYASLRLSGDVEAVILGHSHVPECTKMGRGVYLNAGSWHVDRTYVTVTASSVALRRWNGDDVSVYAFGAAESGRSID